MAGALAWQQQQLHEQQQRRLEQREQDASTSRHVHSNRSSGEGLDARPSFSLPNSHQRAGGLLAGPPLGSSTGVGIEAEDGITSRGGGDGGGGDGGGGLHHGRTVGGGVGSTRVGDGRGRHSASSSGTVDSAHFLASSLASSSSAEAEAAASIPSQAAAAVIPPSASIPSRGAAAAVDAAVAAVAAMDVHGGDPVDVDVSEREREGGDARGGGGGASSGGPVEGGEGDGGGDDRMTGAAVGGVVAGRVLHASTPTSASHSGRRRDAENTIRFAAGASVRPTGAALSDPTKRRVPAAAANPANGGSCVCCLESPAVVVFYRCGHLCCCMPCATTIFHGAAGARLCPCCRAPIIEIIRAYGAQAGL